MPARAAAPDELGERIYRDASDAAIVPGWPRPYYLKHDKLPRPVQWITATAGEQIAHCSADRTYTAGARFACSCCAALLTFGVILDAQWVAEHAAEPRYRKDSTLIVEVYDTNYGSPLCVRCAEFALRVCPFFSGLDHRHSDALTWTLVTSASDYREFDETSALELTTQGQMRDKVTSGWLRQQVTSGNLGLTGQVLSETDVERRPDSRRGDTDS